MKLLDNILPWRTKKVQSEHVKKQRAIKAYRRAMRAYAAGKVDRLTAGWGVTQVSADYDIRNALVGLRSRARELEQNDALAKRYVALCKKNIAGAYGFTLKVKACDYDNQGNKIPDKLANNLIRDAWLDWCKKENCDVGAQDSFRRIQHLLIAHCKRDGEILVKKIRNNSKYGFQLQILEPDILDETYNAVLNNGNVIIMGVEFNKYRKRVAYHLKVIKPELDVYSSGAFSETQRVSADQIYYDFDKMRAFQSRGVTPMHAALMRMRNIADYESASVTNAVIAARRLGFIETELPEDVGQLGKPASVNGEEEQEGDETDVIVDTQEGSWLALPPGMRINQPDPKYPDAQHEMLDKSMGKKIASGLDVSYITLANDLTETSYGSGRIGLLDERETWMMDQEWFIESFLEPVFTDWLERALLNNAITYPNGNALPFAKFDKFNKPYFVGKRWPWIDPEKDANAVAQKMKLKLTNPLIEAAQNGDDFEELCQGYGEAQTIAEKYGLKIDLESKTQDNQPPAAPLPKPKKSNGILAEITS